MLESGAKMRAEKWLLQVRFFKTRALAKALLQGGHLRVNDHHVTKPASMIGVGDILKFTQARQRRVVCVRGLSHRRGSAPEARALYDDLSPLLPVSARAPRYDGKGRPSAKDRRDALKSRRLTLV